MKPKTILNYWPLLKSLGLEYGKQIKTDWNTKTLVCNGQYFHTAKQIYQHMTAIAQNDKNQRRQ